MRSVYLDYNGSGPLDPRVAEIMVPILIEGIGNASSVHRFGRQQNVAIDEAREHVGAFFKGLIAMMLGGMGSLPGAILGGLLLGVAEGHALWYLGNEYKDLSAYALLALVLIALWLVERSRLGSVFRMLGSDDLLAEMQGLDTVRYRILAAGMAGAIAGIGGALYAHFTTYVEPQFFNVMLGVHVLAYGLIGGLGTAFGPLVGVAIDIGFLEAVRFIQGYRMIVFGGLVAVLLIFMPRGILDEERVHRLKALFPKRSHARAAGS